MSYVQGEDCGQAALLPATIEDYVAADAPVRVIDAFVDGLDVRGLGFGDSKSPLHLLFTRATSSMSMYAQPCERIGCGT